MKRIRPIAVLATVMMAMFLSFSVQGGTTLTRQRHDVSSKARLVKSTSLAKHFTAPRNAGDRQGLSINDFFLKTGRSPGDNMLLKNAPNRLSAAQVAGNKLFFTLFYDFEGTPLYPDYMSGGWEVPVTQQMAGGFTIDDMYFPGSIPLNVDYNAKTAELVCGAAATYHWTDTVKKSSNRYYYYDTLMTVTVFNESYFQDSILTNVSGTVYDDGSMYFQDGFYYYVAEYYTQSSSVSSVVTRDTLCYHSPVMRETYLMTPNGRHDYEYYHGKSYREPSSNNVYMYQADNSTVLVWGMWGFPARSKEMFIHEDGTMEFPSLQVMATWDMTAALENDWPGENWQNSEFYNLAMDYDHEADTLITYSENMGSKWGTVNSTEIAWDASVITCTIYKIEDGQVIYSDFRYELAPYVNNKLTLTDGSHWFENDPVNETVTVDGITYQLGENGVIEVVAADGQYSGDLVIPGTVTIDGVTYTVTSIAADAFKNCTDLTSVTIPSTVTTIGENAFEGCTGLQGVYINDLEAWCNITFGNANSNPLSSAHHLFLNGEEVTDLVIPDTVTVIPDYAFYGCSALTSITFPGSLYSIGSYAFYGCSGLSSLTFPGSLNSIGYGAFMWCSGLAGVTFSGPVGYIGGSAFNYCNSLTSVTCLAETPPAIGDGDTFPPSVTDQATLYIPEGTEDAYQNAEYWQNFSNIQPLVNEAVIHFADANVKALCVANWDTNTDGELSYTEAAAVTDLGKVFKNNADITSFNELQYFTGLKAISDSAFFQCKALTSIILPDSITTIGGYAFYYCNGFTSINIPATVTRVNTFAFSGCSNLNRVDITDLEAWCKIMFIDGNSHPCNNAHHLFLNGEEIKDLVIPTSIKKLQNFTFLGCSGLTSVTFHDSFTEFGWSSFGYCTDLTSIEIPATVTSITNYTFYKCTGLTSLVIPKTVTNIGDGAFIGCSGLTSITVEDGNPKYDSRDGCNAIIETATNKFLTGCMNSFIPNSVTAIWKAAFYYCTGLTSIDIPNSVTSIGNEAFLGCSSLTSIEIPDNVTELGQGALRFCTNLTTATIGNGVPTIDFLFGGYSSSPSLTHVSLGRGVTSVINSTFSQCNALADVTCLAPTPPAIDRESALPASIARRATLHVPARSLEAYQTAEYWMNFGTILPIDDVDPADVDGNGEINISDVTRLIDILLGKVSGGGTVGDVDGDGSVNISDVTALIDFILHGV